MAMLQTIKNSVDEVITDLKFKYSELESQTRMVFSGAVLVYLASQFPHVINNIKNDLSPSIQRQAFEKAYNVDLQGWPSVIESNPRNIGALSEILEKERQERSFGPVSIRIKDRSFFKTNPFDHLTDLIMNQEGRYNKWTYSIVSKGVAKNKIQHELKHLKTDEVIAQEPSFRTDWESLSLDERGKSLYFNSWQKLALKTFFLEGTVPFMSDDDARKIGFISEYSRYDFREDVAELAEFAERGFNPEAFTVFQYGVPDKRLVAKMQLLEKYSLVPKGYLDSLKLFWENREITSFVDDAPNFDFEKAFRFMKESEAFLNKYPGSALEEEVGYVRSRVAEFGFKILVSKNDVLPKGDLRSDPVYWTRALKFSDVEREYISLIKAPYKTDKYLVGLVRLGSLYYSQGDREKGKAVHDAIRYYKKRFNEGNVLLPRNGVNDLLVEKGIFR